MEIQAIDVVRFEADAQFDAAMAHQFLHLFVDHIVHRDVDLRVTLAKYLQRVGQQVAGKGRHGCHRNPAQLQGETLAQHFFGVVPVGQQAPRQWQQYLALGSQADAACGAAQQGAAKVFFQGLDGQAQGRLRDMQVFTGLGEALVLGHSDKGAQLLDVHDRPFGCFAKVINR
ncbi:hypothetical protein D3C75_851490 [compost metagenome]